MPRDDDEFENLAKFLTFLRKDPFNSHFSEEISKVIDLPLETVKAIAENAILNQWVDLETRVTHGNPLIKINYDGNKKLNQLTGKSNSLPSQGNVTNIYAKGKNINIGTGNVIHSENITIPNSESKFSKWQLIVAIIVGGVVIYGTFFGLTPFSEPSEEPETIYPYVPEQLRDKIPPSDVYIIQGKIIESDKLPDGETGMTFVDKELGFMISRPNHDWNFVYISKHTPAESESVNYDLGFMMVKKEVCCAGVAVLVFDSSDPSLQNFTEHIEQKKDFYTSPITIDLKTGSESENSFYLTAHGKIPNGADWFLHHRVIKHEQKIYMIVASSQVLEGKFDDYNDAEFVRKSFTTL